MIRRAWAAILVLGLSASASFAQADKRADFVRNVVPKKYPQMIDYVRKNGPLQVTWAAQSGEPQSLTVRLSSEGHLVIETAVFAGSATSASTTKDRTPVVMTDRSLKGRLEYLSAHPPGGRRQTFERPTDEGSLFLWDSSLAIIFRQSKCCPK